MSKPTSGTILDTGHALYTGLTAAWGMLEGSGTTSADSRGNGHTLTLNSGSAWGTSGSDVAITFNGSGAPAVSVASPITLSPSSATAYSVAWRGHQTSSDLHGMILGSYNVGSDFLLYDGGSFFRFFSHTSQAADFTGVTSFTADADYLLTYDPSTLLMRLYRDGAEVSGSPAAISAAEFRIDCMGSAFNSSSLFLVGATTYAYVWSGRKLAATDAATLHANPYAIFQTGSPATTATLTGPTSGTVSAASSDFTVALDGTYSGTVTPASSGTGTFSPTSLSGAGTFTYTPSTTTGSPHSISITSSPALTYSGSPIAYTVNSAPTLSRSPATAAPDTEMVAIALTRSGGSAWTTGLPGSPAFAVNAGSAQAQEVLTSTTANVYLWTPRAAATVAITDPLNSITATVSVPAPTVTGVVVCAGHSLTQGTGSSGGNDYPSLLQVSLGGGWAVHNTGLGGQQASDVLAAYSAQIGTFYDATKAYNVLVIWDLTGTVYFGGSAAKAVADIAAICVRARSQGFKVVVPTVFTRGPANFPGSSLIGGSAIVQKVTFDSVLASANAAMRAGWRGYADALVDIAADDRWSPPGLASGNTLFADDAHCSNAGYAVVRDMVLVGLSEAIAQPPGRLHPVRNRIGSY